MKKSSLNVLAAIVTLFSVNAAFAGSSNAEVKCISASGRTAVDAYVIVDDQEQNLKFTIDGQSISYINQIAADTIRLNLVPQFKVNNPEGYAQMEQTLATSKVVDIKTDNRISDKILNVEITSGTSRLLSFKADSKTVNVKRGSHGSRKGTFEALVRGVDPRDGTLSKEITVSCTYHYSI